MMKRRFFSICVDAVVAAGAAGVAISAGVNLSNNAQSGLSLENIEALAQVECYPRLGCCGYGCYYEHCGYCNVDGTTYYIQDCMDCG